MPRFACTENYLNVSQGIMIFGINPPNEPKKLPPALCFIDLKTANP
jgi:hypothetical protein